MGELGKLRFIADDELELMRSWRNAPSVRANMYTRHEISAEEHRAWWCRISQTHNHRYFIYESAGTPSGIVGFNDIDDVNGNSAWAFYAAPDAPKGTGTRMELLALEHAFYELKLHKLYCEVLAFNSQVIKLHQKFGFQIEGIFRQQHLGDDGFVDIYRLGLLATEWSDKRGEMTEKITLASTRLK